uniref:Leucine-rich repeat-containing N-terminal plant-type domain-containing protein n=1 Tax=Oryza punctata TaxID=4537 RepID=A0A0E0LS85_ORYPU
MAASCSWAGWCSRVHGLQQLRLRLSKQQERIQSKTLNEEMDWCLCAHANAVAALNAILGRWGKKASPAWNISGEPCSGAAIDGTDIDDSATINPGITCDCSFNNRTVCHITKLNLQQNYLTGPVPSFIGKLTFLQYL